MVDSLSTYSGGGGPMHISRREIEKMKKSMKKVPVIQLQSDVYHETESHVADAMLGNITATIQPEVIPQQDIITPQSTIQPTFRKQLTTRLHKLFTSSRP